MSERRNPSRPGNSFQHTTERAGPFQLGSPSKCFSASFSRAREMESQFLRATKVCAGRRASETLRRAAERRGCCLPGIDPFLFLPKAFRMVKYKITLPH